MHLDSVTSFFLWRKVTKLLMFVLVNFTIWYVLHYLIDWSVLVSPGWLGAAILPLWQTRSRSSLLHEKCLLCSLHKLKLFVWETSLCYSLATSLKLRKKAVSGNSLSWVCLSIAAWVKVKASAIFLMFIFIIFILKYDWLKKSHVF